MRASKLGALVALALAGCNFALKGVEPGTPVDTGDMSIVDVDLGGDDAGVGGGGGGGGGGGSSADLSMPPPSPDLATPPDLTVITGLLTGSIAQTPTATAINLTTEGVLDWAHWGTANKNSFDHKNAVTQQISDFTNIGNTTISQLGTYVLGFTWTDGTPTATATNSTTGVYTNGMGSGFRITVPADTTTRTLRLYAGGQMSSATVLAHLSDGSAADYTTTTMASASDTGTQFERTVTLVYRAAAAAQTLTITWSQSSAGGFVHLHSATLQ